MEEDSGQALCTVHCVSCCHTRAGRVHVVFVSFVARQNRETGSDSETEGRAVQLARAARTKASRALRPSKFNGYFTPQLMKLTAPTTMCENQAIYSK